MAMIILTAVGGSTDTTILVAADAIWVNDTAYNLDALTSDGPVRLSEDGIIVEYARDGVLSSCQVGEQHSVVFNAVVIPALDQPLELMNPVAPPADDPVDPVQ